MTQDEADLLFWVAIGRACEECYGQGHIDGQTVGVNMNEIFPCEQCATRGVPPIPATDLGL